MAAASKSGQHGEAIDDTDARIIAILRDDGRATLARLAEATGLSVSAVQSRVQKLEHRGVIRGYRAVIDEEAIGYPLAAFVAVTPLDYSEELTIPERLRDIDGVVSCYAVTGAPSYMLLVRAQSPSQLEALLNRIHQAVPVSTESSVILQAYFEERW